MHFISFLLIVLTGILTVPASALAASSPYFVKETHKVPNRWKQVGAPAPDQCIYLQIGLTQSRFDDLERHLYEGI
jgi:tripeptidyl-peptidase-1